MRLFAALSLVPWLLACAAAPRVPAGAELTLSPGDGRVGEYVSSWRGFRTSSYWIEGPTGLVLIDTQFLPSAAEEMVAWAEKVTGKKAVLAIVLHPNPDKFNGTETLRKRGIRVITSKAVAELIPAVHQLRTGWFYDRFKPDYPVATPQPEAFSPPELEAAGLRLRLHALGPGCSQAHLVVEHAGHVFVGDLVTRGFHAWLELGMLDEWLKRLDEIRALRPERVHTGRGGSGEPELLARQQEYLRAVKAILLKHGARGGRPWTEKLAERIQAEVVARYPAYDYPRFVANGLEESWDRLSP
jgi:glyoxylase-like metal-dependent hydrolase (beta-lactamase superfamily II)